jgi:mono/diheme cytochrome c family protein
MMTGRSLGISVLFAFLSLTTSAHADYVAMSGAELYGRFCASCHGATGRGDGPVSKAFKSEVPDLTLIVRRHGGVFPRESIERIIDGRMTVFAHGARDMPVWGEEFGHTELGNPDAERATQLIIQRLLDYVQALQRPNTAVTKQ